MKTKLSLLTLGLSAVVASSAFAGDIKPLHSCVQTGLYNQSLGSSSTAKDKYRVTCPAGTKSFQAKVRDEPGVAAPVVSVNITASSAAGSTDGARSDTVDDSTARGQCVDTGFSSYSTRTLTTTSTAPVTFDFEVYKSATGSEVYSVSEHCRNGASPTPGDLGNGTGLTVIQNQ